MIPESLLDELAGGPPASRQPQPKRRALPVAPAGAAAAAPAKQTLSSATRAQGAAKSVAPDHAYTHQATLSRVAHLSGGPMSRPGSKETPRSKPAPVSFLYAPADAAGGDRSKEKALDDALDATEFTVVTSLPEPRPPGDALEQLYPALRPAGRKEVAYLQLQLANTVKTLHTETYPTDMHAFLSIIQQEEKLYDSIFQELIRQVTVHMAERGQVLAEIRSHYAAMFSRIPQHVKSMYTDALAQRKINKRLAVELRKSKQTIAELLQEMTIIKAHDEDVTKQSKTAHEKLVAVLTQSDNTDEILDEYHKLYKMQRDRLEESIKVCESEKRIWIDAAINLSLRIGREHGLGDLVSLQKAAYARLRNTNSVIIQSCNYDTDITQHLQRQVSEWRTKITRLSQSVVSDDQTNLETVTKIQRGMKMVHQMLLDNEPVEQIDLEHPALKVFQILDVRTINQNLQKWVEDISEVALRFTSDKDSSFREESAIVKKLVEKWLESANQIIKRNTQNTNGKVYEKLQKELGLVIRDIEKWLDKLELRITGDDGVASMVISLQNALEDRFTAFTGRDMSKALAASERTQMKDMIKGWSEQIVTLLGVLSDTTEKEQHKVPLRVEKWITKLNDQLSTDSDVKMDENQKLHAAMLSWMVNILVRGGKELPTEQWDSEFMQLHQEIISFNLAIIHDAHDLPLLSDENKDLRQVVQSDCEQWMTLAKRILKAEKESAEKKFRKEPAVDDDGDLEELLANVTEEEAADMEKEKQREKEKEKEKASK